MKQKSSKQINCANCGEKITLNEYEGLEGTWYTGHVCKVLSEKDGTAAFHVRGMKEF